MFTVTAGALRRLSTKLILKNGNEDQAFRFTRRTGGWRLRLDSTRKEDKEFLHDGRSVLALDAKEFQAIAQLKLDVKCTESGLRLKLCRVKSGKD